ncbi:MAG TPA: S9 family peptidase [Ktedonobacteraceae bacterium]
MTAPTSPRRTFCADDLWALRIMGQVALSPDGRRVAFVMHSMDRAQNENHAALYLLHLDEQGRPCGEPRQLTSGVKNDSSPTWAPDSRRLLFLSDREEKNQLWLIDTDGGEASKLTDMLHGVSEAAWSPDGRWIAFTASASTDDDDALLMGRTAPDEQTRKRIDDEQKFALRTVDRIFYRLDGRGLYEKGTQLFIMSAPASSQRSDPADIRRLTRDSSDYLLLSWTPDSQEIGALRNRERDATWTNDLWAIQPETGEARRLTSGTLEIASYAWSPDGKQALLVAASDDTPNPVRNTQLRLVPRGGGEISTLETGIDNMASPAAFAFPRAFPAPYRPQWSADGKTIYFVVTEQGSVNVYCLHLGQQKASPLFVGEHLIFFLALLPGERGLLVARDEPLHPWELYLVPLPEGQVECLTQLQDRYLADIAWSEPEHFVYQGANGEPIDGWIMLPPGARAGVRYPLILTIHGGPHSAYGNGMNFNHQYFVAHGFALFYCNPHGSTGSGEAFMRQVVGDWGGLDFQDIMLGVDQCIARGVADPERMAVTGYSYGGYMSMFTIGHSARFKAAVPMAGVSNLSSFVGTSDVGFWMVKQARGYPWDPERADYYRDRSPISSAGHVSTPTLFLHPENDLRCPIEQSEQFYIALKMIGKVPVEFVRAPASWHIGNVKPAARIAYWDTMLEWFGRYIQVRPEDYD